jgi:hypothetical protein
MSENLPGVGGRDFREALETTISVLLHPENP